MEDEVTICNSDAHEELRSTELLSTGTLYGNTNNGPSANQIFCCIYIGVVANSIHGGELSQ